MKLRLIHLATGRSLNIIFLRVDQGSLYCEGPDGAPVTCSEQIIPGGISEISANIKYVNGAGVVVLIISHFNKPFLPLKNKKDVDR